MSSSSSSSPSLPCAAGKCELASLALCQCCKQDLCIDHLNEHANQRNEKLVPFIDKINVLLARFNRFNQDNEQTNMKQFEQWKQNAYKLIDEFHEKKSREYFGETIDQQREQLNHIHTRLTELIRKKGGTQQDFDRFTDKMNSIEQYLDKIEQNQIEFPTLIIDDNCIIRPVEQQQTVPIINEQSSKEHDDSVDKSNTSRRSSKRKKKSSSSRRSNDSSDRSSGHRSRSPKNRRDRSKRKHDRSSDSNSSHSPNSKKAHCDDCQGCRFYQDRFGPGFMDAFGPCSCECHKWAYL